MNQFKEKPRNGWHANVTARPESVLNLAFCFYFLVTPGRTGNIGSRTAMASGSPHFFSFSTSPGCGSGAFTPVFRTVSVSSFLVSFPFSFSHPLLICYFSSTKSWEAVWSVLIIPQCREDRLWARVGRDEHAASFSEVPADPPPSRHRAASHVPWAQGGRWGR